MYKHIELLEDRKPKNLSAYQLDMLAGVLSKRYDEWREASQPHVDEIKKIRKYIYQSQKGQHNEGDPFALSSIYKLNEAIKAHIKENIYATNASVFDVKGEDEESQETANLHKWDIVNDLERIDFKGEKASTFLKNFNETGEMIAVIGLVTNTTKRKTEVEVPDTITDFNGNEIETTVVKLGIEEIETYDGVEVFPIKSEDFQFDTTKANRFKDSVCGKFIRSWLSYNEIIENKAYELLNKKSYGKEVKEYLKRSIRGQEPDYDMLRDDTGIEQTTRDMFAGDQVEVLEYWGDILFDDIELRNYLITMAGNRIIRCEPNPYYNNTIIYYARDTHPDYKRGISPLRVALRAADIASNITNEIVQAFPYIANPVTYSPKGSVINKKEKPKPGGQIEYETDLNKNPPIPIDVSGVLRGFDLIQFFDNQTNGAVGMSDAMLGAVTEEKKTATEIKAMQVGGSIRISDMIDGIKQGFNIPCIKVIADIKANFEDGENPIGVIQGDGGVKEEVVNDKTRRGKYRYTYIDSKATMERQAQFKEVMQFLGLILKVDPTIVNLQELLKHGLTETGYQDVERFLKKDEFDEALRQILDNLGLDGNDPKLLEMAKAKITRYLPLVVEQVINDERIKRADEIVPDEGMGAMSPDLPTGGIQTGRSDRPAVYGGDETNNRDAGISL